MRETGDRRNTGAGYRLFLTALAAAIAAAALYFAARGVTPGHEAKPGDAFYIWLFRCVMLHAAAAAGVCILYINTRAKADGGIAAPGSGNPAPLLFVASFLILFMELALMRWVPAYVKLASYFTNFILMACFLGMGLGCLAAGERKNFLGAAPVFLAVTAVLALVVFTLEHLEVFTYSLGWFSRGERVYFGGVVQSDNLRDVGITLVMGAVFVCVTLVFVGPGQVMGRLFERFRDPVKAYTVNIAASVAGIVCISALSMLGVPAWIWFLAVAAMLLWLIKKTGGGAPAFTGAILIIALGMTFLSSFPVGDGQLRWSPYYKISYNHPDIYVNEIGHQTMVSSESERAVYKYALPYMLSRDAGAEGREFKNVLVIGAGSGNDVSHALKYGARSVRAVDIDPVIIDIGRKNHPDAPYSDPRVSVTVDDGRSFLRETGEKYDLIVYGLVDSLTLMSNLSSIRLENYLFTREALEDVKARLAPGGVFVMYNYFRENWLAVRLFAMLDEVFGEQPLLITVPSYKYFVPEAKSMSMAIFIAGDTVALNSAFDAVEAYYVQPAGEGAGADFNGFSVPVPPADDLIPIYRTEIIRGELPAELGAQAPVKIPTDNWPFLYLRSPKIPGHNVWGLALVGMTSLFLVGGFMGFGGLRRISAHYFFLGGAFMLLETESVVRLALIHGSTWFVNSVVFASVLAMIFAANLFVLRANPRAGVRVYALLFAALAANYFLPPSVFLGGGWFMENIAATAVMFLPIAFAAVIFAASFRRSARPAQDLGSNLLGVMAGGMAEYASLAFGYNALLLIVAFMYLVSMAALPRE